MSLCAWTSRPVCVLQTSCTDVKDAKAGQCGTGPASCAVATREVVRLPSCRRGVAQPLWSPVAAPCCFYLLRIVACRFVSICRRDQKKMRHARRGTRAITLQHQINNSFSLNSVSIQSQFSLNSVSIQSQFSLNSVSIQSQFSLNSVSIQSQFSLNSVSIQSQFSLNSVSIQSQFSLNSVSIQSQFSLNSVSIQSQFSLNSVSIQSQFSLNSVNCC